MALKEVDPALKVVSKKWLMIHVGVFQARLLNNNATLFDLDALIRELLLIQESHRPELKETGPMAKVLQLVQTPKAKESLTATPFEEAFDVQVP